MKRLTLGEIISGSEERLEIFYVGGRNGLNREAGHPFVQPYQVGRMIMPDGLLILSPESLLQLNSMPELHIQAFLNHLVDQNISFIAISDHGRPPENWRIFSEDSDIVLCVSRHNAYLLESRLTGLIREKVDGLKYSMPTSSRSMTRAFC